MKAIINALAALLLLAPFVYKAQNDTAGRGRNFHHNSKYDPKTLVTITGEIISVDEITYKKGQSAGIHLQVKTPETNYTVHVGPKWYVSKQSMTLNTSDKIVVSGSKTVVDGKTVVIARDIKKGNEKLILRSEDGIPVWSGRGRR